MFQRNFALLAQEVEQQREEAVSNLFRILWPESMAWWHDIVWFASHQKQSCLGKNWSVGNHCSLQCASKRRCLSKCTVEASKYVCKNDPGPPSAKSINNYGFVWKFSGKTWKKQRNSIWIVLFYHHVLS